MAKTELRQKALLLRSQGQSYSYIKTALKVSKSTLSLWLRDLPLSEKRIRELRANSSKRIERFRETMRKKREAFLEQSYERAKKDIGTLSKRDILLAGLYLYWGEGTKTAPGKISVANTDPSLIKAAMDWMILIGIPKEGIRIRLHLYKDMTANKEIEFWSRMLSVPKGQFRKPYIKDSRRLHQTYKTGYGHGTCEINFENVPLWRYISMALKRLREVHNHRL